MIESYEEYDGVGLAELVERKQVLPSELVEEAIVRIDRHNGVLNAVVRPMYELARERARALESKASGPPSASRPISLRGVPILLKDFLGDYEGVPTARGSRFMRDVPSPQDHPLVSRYKEAGLVMVAKTNIPELGLLPTTEPALYGPCRNPWNTEHSTGGSSGGSAAAVAAGIVPIAHANDGAGSIRIPASCCGVFGLKPTRARNPMGPELGHIMGGMVVEHVVTRSVRDSAAVLDATHGPAPGDPYAAPPPRRPYLEEVGLPAGKLRIAAWGKHLDGSDLHPECSTAVSRTVALCEELGHTVEEVPSPIDVGALRTAFVDVYSAGLAVGIEAFAALNGRTLKEGDLEGFTLALYERGKSVTASQYQIGLALMQIAGRELALVLERYDSWMTSVLCTPPVRLGAIDGRERNVDAMFDRLYDYAPFAVIANATGHPAMSVPLHWTQDGLPVGVMFFGRFGDEGTLFRLAAQLEEARPWRSRKPPVWG